MSSTEPTTAHYRAAIRQLRNDTSARDPWDYMTSEDYTDALASVSDAVEYYGSPERGSDNGAGHDWADSGAIYPHEWADANPRALDYWAADAASNFGADILTTDVNGQPAADVLDRIRAVARYSCLRATWEVAAQDVERIAGELADADPFAGWVAA